MSWLAKKVTEDSEESVPRTLVGRGFELNQDELEKQAKGKHGIPTGIQNENMDLVEVDRSGFTLQLMHKLNEIDRCYKHGVFEYKENIQAYNIEIEKLKDEIELERVDYDKEEKNIFMIEHELAFENKAYDKLQIKFSQLIHSIEELKNEYKDVLDEVRYALTLKRKEKDLFELLDEIEVSELTLLNKELDRLNLLERFEPKKVQFKRLKIALKELEMEKTYFESMGLDKVSSVQIENKSFWKEESSEIVDTVEVDSAK